MKHILCNYEKKGEDATKGDDANSNIMRGLNST